MHTIALARAATLAHQCGDTASREAEVCERFYGGPIRLKQTLVFSGMIKTA